MKRLPSPILLGALLVGGYISGTAAGELISGPTKFAPTPPARDQGLEMAREHDCWTGEAPADMRGKYPGHVVIVTKRGRVIYGGEPYVGNALDQVFGGENHGYRVVGFCR